MRRLGDTFKQVIAPAFHISPVLPAKAGISGARERSERQETPEIPAFAGMMVEAR
jgi:hypothetical protein